MRGETGWLVGKKLCRGLMTFQEATVNGGCWVGGGGGGVINKVGGRTRDRTEEEEEEDAVITEQAENGGLGEGQACWITRLALIIPLLTWI